jgi:parvulin-like peptidyl-prolyl isomerase
MNRFLTAQFSLFSWVLISWSAQGGKIVDRSVAVVNNDIILESDIAKFQKKIKSKSFQELFGGVDEKVVQSKEAALQLLIEEKIINQNVKKLELGASDQEVEGQIRSIQKRNNISEAQLKERLKQLGTTLADYKESVKRQIERRNLVEREIKPSMEVSEEQLRRFYERNAKSQDKEVQYRIAHILVESKEKKGQPVNKAAEEKANKIFEMVAKNPDSFEKTAQESSDDSSTASNGGNLGYFSTSQLSKEFRDIVTRTGVGAITKPVKTAAGYHIIKVLDKKTGDFYTLPKERKDALKNQMLGEEMEKRMGMWLERKKAEAFIKIYADAKEPSDAKSQNQ